jgi:predicted small lipoprotein YifL
MQAGRWLKLTSLSLALLGVPACGQMGPLSLPTAPGAEASAAPDAETSAAPDAEASAAAGGQTPAAPEAPAPARAVTESSVPRNADDADDER